MLLSHAGSAPLPPSFLPPDSFNYCCNVLGDPAIHWHKTYSLSASFRMGPHIASAANRCAHGTGCICALHRPLPLHSCCMLSVPMLPLPTYFDQPPPPTDPFCFLLPPAHPPAACRLLGRLKGERGFLLVLGGRHGDSVYQPTRREDEEGELPRLRFEQVRCACSHQSAREPSLGCRSSSCASDAASSCAS